MRETVDFSSVNLTSGNRSALYSSGPLNLYQRLIQYFGIVAECSGTYLDLVNFNSSVFPVAISFAELEAIFDFEHGYSCPDGSIEMSDLILAYEMARTRRFSKSVQLFPVRFAPCTLAAGIGAGVTGVMNCLIPAVRDFCNSQRTPNSPHVVITLPQYSVYDGLAAEHGVTPLYLRTRLEEGFLPTSEEVAIMLRNRPMALILTFPVNPAQTTYDHRRIGELSRIIQLCQTSGTFLIVDNIYQDTIWNESVINPEIFSLTSSSEFLVKVFGPSKDRPGFSGLRMGYFCGDIRLKQGFLYHSSIQYNTPNSASRCLFALDLLFRLLLIEREPLTSSILMLLGDNIAGWDRSLDREAVADRLLRTNMLERYKDRLHACECKQSAANDTLRSVAVQSNIYRNVINDRIGNVLLLQINPEVFGGSDHDLFLHLLNKGQLGVLPGNAFGFSIQRGEAWFRITTIHAPAEEIAASLHRIPKILRS